MNIRLSSKDLEAIQKRALAPSDFTMSTFAPLHTAVTVAPKCLASCTPAEPMLPEAPMISSS